MVACYCTHFYCTGFFHSGNDRHFCGPGINIAGGLEMIDLKNVGKLYHANGKKVAALDDFSLHVDAGEFYVVRGPSGSGKTTLLLTIGAMLRPDNGKVACRRRKYLFAQRRRTSKISCGQYRLCLSDVPSLTVSHCLGEHHGSCIEKSKIGSA